MKISKLITTILVTASVIITAGCATQTHTYNYDLDGNKFTVVRSGCNYYNVAFVNQSSRDMDYWYGELIALDADKTTLGATSFACLPTTAGGNSRCQVNDGVVYNTAGFLCKNIQKVTVKYKFKY